MLLCVAVVGHLLQVGIQPQPQRLAPDWSRLNPLATALQMFSGDSAVRELLGVLKLAVVLSVAAWALWNQRDPILALGNLSPAALATTLAELVGGICLKVGGALLVVAAADYGFQRWRYELSLRMTPEEMREEMRNQKGTLAVQRRRRQLQSTLALTHLEAAVAQAQLVLVQGTSWAVALQYDSSTMPAPIVVAKGTGDTAAKIRLTAEQTNIRVAQEPRLTQTIASQTPIGSAIAAEHYRTVAELMP